MWLRPVGEYSGIERYSEMDYRGAVLNCGFARTILPPMLREKVVNFYMERSMLLFE